MAVAFVLRQDHVGRVLHPEPVLLVVVRHIAANVDVMRRRSLAVSGIDLNPVAAISVDQVVDDPGGRIADGNSVHVPRRWHWIAVVVD